MNHRDEFVEIIDGPTKRLEIRSDLHFVQLTSNTDLWYGGGGAFDNAAFGYIGRPANLHNSLATVADLSTDSQLTKALAVNTYYAHSFGKSVVGRSIHRAGTPTTATWNRFMNGV